jgi:hypothetical protein
MLNELARNLRDAAAPREAQKKMDGMKADAILRDRCESVYTNIRVQPRR